MGSGSGCGVGVWGLGFGVWGLGFGVWGLGSGVWGWGLGVRYFGIGGWGSVGVGVDRAGEEGPPSSKAPPPLPLCPPPGRRLRVGIDGDHAHVHLGGCCQACHPGKHMSLSESGATTIAAHLISTGIGEARRLRHIWVI